MYLGNDNYEISLSSGETVTLNKSDFEEFVYLFNKESSEPHDKIVTLELTPYNEAFTHPKLQKTLIEVKDGTFKNVEWNEDLSTVVEEVIDASIMASRDYYEQRYFLTEK